MPTDFMYVSGKVKWFRHTTPNEWGKWSHQMYLNPESLEKIRELQSEGVKNVIKKDEDGYYIRFNRPCEKEVKGKMIGLKPPEVFMSDGVTPLKATNIGNGSDVTTKLEVYSYRVPGQGDSRAKAIRWLSSRIDNLVPFESTRDFLEDEEKAARGLADQPPQF